MRFFKKGDKVLIKSCYIASYNGLTGTVISHTRSEIHIMIDEKFHCILERTFWVYNPNLPCGSTDVINIRNKILKNKKKKKS